MDMQDAILEAGFKASTARSKTTMEKVIDGLLAPITQSRKIVITKAGEYVRARYEGRKTFVIGFDERIAVSRLKTWDGGAD